MTIIVPYRDRPEHLEKFTAAMRDHTVVVVEQAPSKPFNRGKLINIGFIETQPAYFCAHDVDMIPIGVDYTPALGVTQLAGSAIQITGYLGGVTMYDTDTFRFIGGYHNEYFHRAEDNEMAFNLARLQIPVVYRIGTFIDLPHERTGPEFIPHLWVKAQRPRQIQNQLSICEYKVLSRHINGNLTHIIVEI